MMSPMPSDSHLKGLLDALRGLIQQGRQQALRAVDMVQVQTQSTQVKVFNSFSASWIYEVFAVEHEVLKGFPGDGKFVRRSGRADCAARSLAFCRSRHPVEAGAAAA